MRTLERPPAGTINVFEVNGTWTEGTLTIPNSPPKFPTPMFTFSVAPSNTNTFILVDVTQAVKDWYSKTRPNNGLTFVPSNTSAIAISLDSKENALTSHPMELEVVLAAAAGGRRAQLEPRGRRGRRAQLEPQGRRAHLDPQEGQRAQLDPQGRRAQPGPQGRPG